LLHQSVVAVVYLYELYDIICRLFILAYCEWSWVLDNTLKTIDTESANSFLLVDKWIRMPYIGIFRDFAVRKLAS